jgi:hypothetical protein
MTKIERFCQQNLDAPERIALAYEQMRFWEEKRRSHQMIQGTFSNLMFESKLRHKFFCGHAEFKRRLKVGLDCIARQKCDPFGKPVLP